MNELQDKEGKNFSVGKKREKMGIICAVGKANLWKSECEREMLLLRVMGRNALGSNCQNIYIMYYISTL